MNQNIIKLNHRNHSVASDILELSLQSYRIECDLLGLETFPPLNESTDDIEKSEGIFWGLYVENTLVAVLEISTLVLERNTNAKNIDRLVVSPEHFRRGFGQAMLRFCCGARGVYSVSTGRVIFLQ
ncbi:hypothetical protein CS022_03950 [Veronia nyctiphanis]|uniref:N-acetyltransferase domain-containing protein n=1 Tax=Veronia nyctiphanis TaxID=1278244 RepID=A0A4V1LT76_9GAMM|nr:GNAT family N-acetyltransferase [Veronia nyctiphanis]RXJ74228.1 hypothetical protein CS022_03950 [Veronia nyctiphanis]